eukprot:9059261-Alexandrium_andersonii.AAC.1
MSSTITGSLHELAVTGRSYRERAPRSNCDRYSRATNSRCTRAWRRRPGTSRRVHPRVVDIHVEAAP